MKITYKTIAGFITGAFLATGTASSLMAATSACPVGQVKNAQGKCVAAKKVITACDDGQCGGGGGGM